jgi:hypothetical protein
LHQLINIAESRKIELSDNFYSCSVLKIECINFFNLLKIVEDLPPSSPPVQSGLLNQSCHPVLIHLQKKSQRKLKFSDIFKLFQKSFI